MEAILASLRKEERSEVVVRLRPATLAGLIALSLAATLLAVLLTRTGAGASGDSAYYIMGARNIRDGNGYARLSGSGELKPITGFPPAFSIVLAGIGFSGIDAFDAARVLNAVLFGASVLLSGMLIHRVSRSSMAALIGGSLLLVNSTLVELHSWVMSEPLYILLFLLGIWALASGIDRGSRWLLIVAGLLAGLTMLTRYLGVSFMIAGGITILLVGDEGRRSRALSAVLFGVAAGLPLLLWIARNASLDANLINREILFHSIDGGLVAAYQAELIAWVFARQLPVPWRPRAILAASVAAIGPLHFLASWLRSGGLRRPKGGGFQVALPWLLCLYLLAYAGVLAFNSMFLDAATTLSAPARYLAPAYVALVILSTATLAGLIRSIRSWTVIPRALALALGALVLTLQMRQTLQTLSGDGLDLGYVGVRRDWPEIVTQLSWAEPSLPLISNNPEMVYVLAGRPAYPLPASYDPYTEKPRQDYRQQVALSRALLAEGGLLVMFGSPDELALQALEDIGVEPLVGFDAAMFYQAPSGSEG